MTTTTTTMQQGYVVYSLTPDPYPDANGIDGEPIRYSAYDKRFATALCLFVVITSVVLICLYFLIGHAFTYIMLIIIVILLVALFIAYRVRRPGILFPMRATTLVKFPNSYAMHVIPGPQLPHIYRTDRNSPHKPDNSFYYPYPGPYTVPFNHGDNAAGANVNNNATECKVVK
ncbi:unnamed protein product [Medioppia subpectinata]|uniref:Uncharacterized protein n=1 Tax=Medioppia subpectinata TaxID=1979941 RepID=A0A7R9Q5P5_9ACAR|nr:unnamed protein product [Medioppia subpectinata]CAG2112487.1 unnamed protein product [Medioppia subpectinata]